MPVKATNLHPQTTHNKTSQIIIYIYIKVELEENQQTKYIFFHCTPRGFVETTSKGHQQNKTQTFFPSDFLPSFIGLDFLFLLQKATKGE